MTFELRPAVLEEAVRVIQRWSAGAESALWAADALRLLQQQAYGAAVAAGWYIDPGTGGLKSRHLGRQLMLIVSELSEAMEADRKDLNDDKLPRRKGAEVELADALIRLADLAGAGGDDWGAALLLMDRGAPWQDLDSGDDFSTGLLRVTGIVSAGMEGWSAFMAVRIARAILRLADRQGFDIAGALVEKMQYNAVREDHKLANRAQAGGKQY